MKKNFLVLKYFSFILILFIGFIAAPFVFNKFSFSYLNNPVFWGGISPLILLSPTILFALFESEE
ncbi:hypothetical protein J2Z53_000034 [Clostridium moniliforme]|uniref:Uncharacterized protein n=1 Tax=Clostridium moniliforme TaxID=39489 RepID=A0ABS4EWS9_9CLOT|nr:hypothetical protein [Clostridium moniliforme]MBP1888455.1 hypothetical protein [Clostridium moniliforme]